MAAKARGYPFRDSSTDIVPYGRSAQIMNAQGSDFGFLAGSFPGFAKVANLMSFQVEHKRAFGEPITACPLDNIHELSV